VNGYKEDVVECHDHARRIFFQKLLDCYGYDFRNYSEESALRRLNRRMFLSGIKSFKAFQNRVMNNANLAEELIRDFSINVTEMFRNPKFYLALRKKVVPEFGSNPFIKIWSAGCATGEEVFSLAIILKEEGVLDRARIFGTDFNQQALERAKSGIFPLNRMRLYSANYQKAGGRVDFVDYYSARYDGALMRKDLKNRMLFSRHDLTREGVFSETSMILCRNVLIYFNQELKNRVMSIFHQSLDPVGFLCLGSKETLKYTAWSRLFETVSETHRIYRKHLKVVQTHPDNSGICNSSRG
jgi:chemotaxis protein methyltransferase CheR